MKAQWIFDHLTRPLTWVFACFVGLFALSLGGYQSGHIPAPYAVCIGTLAVLGYSAGHFAQYRIGRSLKMTRDAANGR